MVVQNLFVMITFVVTQKNCHDAHSAAQCSGLISFQSSGGREVNKDDEELMQFVVI